MDTISRQAAIKIASGYCHPANIAEELAKLPSAHGLCRECRWAGYYGIVDKYWHCYNWGGETDEEGFCHKWEGRDE